MKPYEAELTRSAIQLIVLLLIWTVMHMALESDWVKISVFLGYFSYLGSDRIARAIENKPSQTNIRFTKESP